MSSSDDALATTELLRKAVISLEKKLTDKCRRAQELEQERDQLIQEIKRSSTEIAEKERVIVDTDRLQKELVEKDQELKDCKQREELLQAFNSKLKAQVEELESCKESLSTQVEQWKSDREKAEVACARAESLQQIQQMELQQLEAANQLLRVDLKTQIDKLQQAYRREEELSSANLQLKKSSQIDYEQRHQKGAHAEPCKCEICLGTRSPLITLYQDLFKAAAGQVLRSFTAKVIQAETKADLINKRLQRAESQLNQLSRHNKFDRLKLQLSKQQLQTEEHAVQELLQSNMRLHESLIQLKSEAKWESPFTKQFSKVRTPSHLTHQISARSDHMKQQKKSQTSSKLEKLSTALKYYSHKQDAQLYHHAEMLANEEEARTPRTKESSASQRLTSGLAEARANLEPNKISSSAASRDKWILINCQSETVKSGAVQAALSIFAEYRELYEYYQAIAAEFNCIRNRLATAPEEDWQQLSMQHADLFRESRDIAEQMEEKVGQLIALKHTGLL